MILQIREQMIVNRWIIPSQMTAVLVEPQQVVDSLEAQQQVVDSLEVPQQVVDNPEERLLEGLQWQQQLQWQQLQLRWQEQPLWQQLQLLWQHQRHLMLLPPHPMLLPLLAPRQFPLLAVVQPLLVSPV
jgi:hypothetical protein